MSLKEKCPILHFADLGDERGKLVVIEGAEAIPFDIKRVFYIYDSDKEVIRGQHANRESEFVLINVAGKSKVRITDGSEEICERASEYTGIQVKRMLFQELNEQEEYDGIWACASILHLPKRELIDVLQKMVDALKNNGVIYTSFKYGDFEGIRNGRYFIDLTEKSFESLMNEVNGIRVENIWVTGDVRAGRGEEKWLNLLLRKI